MHYEKPKFSTITLDISSKKYQDSPKRVLPLIEWGSTPVSLFVRCIHVYSQLSVMSGTIFIHIYHVWCLYLSSVNDICKVI